MKQMFAVSALSTLFAFTLSACGEKQAAPQTPAPSASQTQASSAVAASTAQAMPNDIEKLLIKSPYMDFQVNANRAMIVGMIKAEKQLSPEQNACLLSLEGNPNYLAVLEPYFKGILSADEIQEADAFFASDAGRKFAEMLLKQAGAEHLPPFVEPTAAEKAEITKALLKPFIVKVKAKTDAMSEQDAIEFTKPLQQSEMNRCKIA